MGKIFIAKNSEEPFVEVSSGNFLQPITTSFILKNSGNTFEKILELYIIAENGKFEEVTLERSGLQPGINVLFSLDQVNWTDVLEIGTIDASVYYPKIQKFYLKFILLDSFDFLDPNEIGNIYNNIKIILSYAD